MTRLFVLVLVFVLVASPAARADIDNPTPVDPSGPAPVAEKPEPERARTGDKHALSGVEGFPKLGLDAYLWVAGYKGKFERERHDNGTEIHPDKSDFGLEDANPAFSARATIVLGPDFAFELEYVNLFLHDDVGAPRRSIVFDGVFIPPNTQLETTVQIEMGTLQARWTLSESEHVRTGFLFGAGVFEERLRFDLKGTGQRIVESAVAYSPFVGFGVGADYAYIGWDVRMRIFGYHTGKDRFGYWDFEALLHVKPTPRFGMHVGFRHVSVDYHNKDGDGDTVGDFNIPALVMGMGFRF